MKLAALQQEVKEWSWSNFGAQESKLYPDMVMGSLAPLLGIAEEFGELNGSSTEADIQDALGDIGIYLCDYASREDITLPEPSAIKSYEPYNRIHPTTGIPLPHGPYEGLAVGIGGLFHCTLKHHQAIRGFGPTPSGREKYRREQDKACRTIIYYADKLSRQHLKLSWLFIVNNTWETIVSKRNWR